MKKVYLDNAATTAMRPEVIAEMARIMHEAFGNPSSTHSFGRASRTILELSRKTIAKCLGAAAQEIIFTSGATEANNLILRSMAESKQVLHIITSKIEHHAVLHAVEKLEKEGLITASFVKIKPSGNIDHSHLSALLADAPQPALVSLMLVNNEIGTVLDWESVSRLCKQYGAYFHTDAVQAVGKMPIELHSIPVDFLTASAHKFHGPKGVGFAFVRKGLALRPLFFGGEQEKGIRPGTESVHNVAGMSKALEMSCAGLETERAHITGLKQYLIDQLQHYFPGTIENGTDTFYNIANMQLPMPSEKTLMILFNLDMKGIAVSRGSACQSGSVKPSHVLAEILDQEALQRPSLRISLSHYNTESDIDALIQALQTL